MRSILTLSVLLLAAGLAAAADPDVAAPLREGETPVATPAPDLDVNRTELEAKTGDRPEGEVVLYTREDAPVVGERPVSPLMADIRAALDEERTRHLELEARFRAAGDERAALEIQREIEALARDTELRILRIQADHARLAGLEETALAAEAAIAEMTAPRPAPQPQDRPAPVNR